jgi:hypothetical protein
LNICRGSLRGWLWDFLWAMPSASLEAQPRFRKNSVSRTSLARRKHKRRAVSLLKRMTSLGGRCLSGEGEATITRRVVAICAATAGSLSAKARLLRKASGDAPVAGRESAFSGALGDDRSVSSSRISTRFRYIGGNSPPSSLIEVH